MLTSRKPGPPVPPRPSAAAVASALAKHRENSPSKPGINTLKPAHPGRTVVYKSPAFDHAKKPQQNASNGFNGTGQSYKKTEVYVGESNGFGVACSENVSNLRNNSSRSSLENGKLMYTSTCSIIEVNSSSSASTSTSSSPVSTLQKSESKSNIYDTRNDRNHSNAHNGDFTSSQKQLKNTYNHLHLDVLGGTTNKRNLPDVIVINPSSQDHDSGTDQNSMDTNSIASNSSLERENNLKNLETRKAHLTEIIIGSSADPLAPTTTVVTNGTSTVIEARNDNFLTNKLASDPSNQVMRSSSIRLPYRPEPEGGEHMSSAVDFNHGVKVIEPLAIDPGTIDSKLSSEKKVAFHELLISELTAMRSAQEGSGDSTSKRHPPSYPAERRSSPDISPEGTATRLARIRTSDWVEVGDNGKEVFLSSCQISLEDSGMEDEEKLDDASSGVGDSWDSVKDAEERITMSMPGLPPLPKSLSGFDLASQQLQSHHHNLHHQQQPSQQQQHQHQHHQQQQQQQHHHHHHQQSSHHHQQHQHLHPQAASHLQAPLQQQQQTTLTLNHHPTNPFIPIGANLQSVSMASLVSQRGQSPVSSISSSNSTAATTTNSGSSGSVRKPTTLDTQLAILRREMYGLRQLDLSLLSQLWALNESIQEFRTMLQEQETLSPPSPTPSNSDINSVSSDDDEDDSSNTQTVGGIIGIAAATVLSSSQSSRMRAPPPPPPNRKAPSRPV